MVGAQGGFPTLEYRSRIDILQLGRIANRPANLGLNCPDVYGHWRQGKEQGEGLTPQKFTRLGPVLCPSQARMRNQPDFRYNPFSALTRPLHRQSVRLMNGSKRSSAIPQSSATGKPSPPSEQKRSALPRLWPAPQSMPYGFFSDLVVTASGQRVDAVPTATVTMTDTVPTTSVTIRVRSITPHPLH